MQKLHLYWCNASLSTMPHFQLAKIIFELFMLIAQCASCLIVLPFWYKCMLWHTETWISMLQRIQLSCFLQVFTQPWYAFVESTTYKYVPKNFFTHKEFVIRIPGIGTLRLTLFRLIWRTAYVCFTTGTIFPPLPLTQTHPTPRSTSTHTHTSTQCSIKRAQKQ